MVRELFLLLSALLMFGVTLSVSAQTGLAAGKRFHIDQIDQWMTHDGLAIKYSLDKQHGLFAGEMIAIRYDIKSNDAVISLKVDNKNEEQAQFTVLRTHKEELTNTETWRYQYHLTVLFSTARIGKQALTIPALIYSEGGRDQYYLDFVEQQITVQSLPVYLPPDILLAPVTITSSINPASSWLRPMTTDYLYHWEINITGTNLNSRLYSDVVRAISTDEYFEFMPTEVSEFIDKQSDVIHHRVQYRIPFTIKTNGRSVLPEIRLQYFNTLTRKLVNIKHPPNSVIALNIYFKSMLILFIILLLINLVTLLVILIRRAWLSYRALRLVLDQFARADTPLQERQAMHYFSSSVGWPVKIGIYQWNQYWQQRVGVNEQILVAIESLAQTLYSQHQPPYDGHLTQAIQSVPLLKLYKLFIQRYFFL